MSFRLRFLIFAGLIFFAAGLLNPGPGYSIEASNSPEYLKFSEARSKSNSTQKKKKKSKVNKSTQQPSDGRKVLDAVKSRLKKTSKNIQKSIDKDRKKANSSQ